MLNNNVLVFKLTDPFKDKKDRWGERRGNAATCTFQVNVLGLNFISFLFNLCCLHVHFMETLESFQISQPRPQRLGAVRKPKKADQVTHLDLPSLKLLLGLI